LADDQPTGPDIIVAGHDVTEQKRAEDALRRLAAVVESSADAIFSKDRECRITSWNPAAERLYGHTASEIVGQPVSVLAPADHAGEEQAILDRALRGEYVEQYETERLAKDGTVIDVSITVSPIRSRSGELVGASSIHREITEQKRTREQLRRSEELFRGGLEHSPIGMTLTNPDGTLERVNTAFARMLGYEHPSLLAGVNFASLTHPDDVARNREGLRAMLEQDRPYVAEKRYLRRDGSTVHAIVGSTAVRDSDGQPVALFTQAKDITDRKRAEEELALRAQLLDLAHDAVIVRDPAQSRVRFWNREAQEIYGYSAAEAVGRVTHELLATEFPESREAVDAALMRDRQWVGELRHTRRDGTVIVVSSRQALQTTEHGAPIAIIELNSDVSERKRAEQQLAHMSRLLARTQEISKTGGWEYDVATGQLTWTDEMYRIHGVRRTSEPPAVSPAIAAYDPESAPVIKAAFKRLLQEGEPYDLELGLIRADGQRIWVHTSGRAELEDGRVVRVDGNITDVTDRKQAEDAIHTLNAELEQRVAARTEQLERVNRELETFAYSVSHDLRAPMRAVDGFSQALLEDYAEKLDEQGRHDLERVRAGAARMGRLIDGVLELSWVSRQRLARIRVDISALATRTVAEVRSSQPDRRVEVEIQDGLAAQADLELVRIVLQNLFDNAFKFTTKTEHARIRFGAVQQAGVSVYFIADNGVGFDMNHSKRLFLPFDRLHRESEFPGDGIGLATVVRAVRKHNGVIWAQGAINQGASFYFTLTAGASPPASAATSEDVIPAWEPAAREDSR
jgi:PAS domain S-box-containing protein